MRVGVVGHVEAVWFARVERVPAPGEIVHAADHWEEAAGGGAVAAAQLSALGAEVPFFTALGDDDRGRAAQRELAGRGIEVHAAWRPGPQRRAFTHLDRQSERTITVAGERHVPQGGDPLPWERLEGAEGCYFTGGDGEALAAGRRARVLVATPRARGPLARAGVRLDALVHSAGDPGEAYSPADLDPPPAVVVSTLGERGGRWEAADGTNGTWAAADPPGPPADAYGCGDSFAAGLTFALARGDRMPDALELAARCGAACMAGRGPYESQLRL